MSYYLEHNSSLKKIMEMLAKLKSMVDSLEESEGQVLFFALFLRENAVDRWDLLISAPWLSINDDKTYRMVTSKVQEALSLEEVVQLSRVVVLESGDPVVGFFQEVCPLTNGGIKQSPQDFFLEPLNERFDFVIAKAYILRCQKLA